MAWGQVEYDLGPLIYQRPHLSDMSSTFLFAYDGRKVFLLPPSLSLRKWLFWKVSDVNESSRTLSQDCKQRADEVSGLFMPLSPI